MGYLQHGCLSGASIRHHVLLPCPSPDTQKVQESLSMAHPGSDLMGASPESVWDETPEKQQLKRCLWTRGQILALFIIMPMGVRHLIPSCASASGAVL